MTRWIESLEGRRLLCGGHPQFSLSPVASLAAPSAGITSAAPLASPLGVPALSSLPGAPAKLVLDFDGDAASVWDFGGGTYDVTPTPAYSRDADAGFFSQADVSAIRDVWARVAEMYAPFNLNVTTLDDGDLTNGRTAKVIIGGRGDWLGQTAGGVGTYSGFSNIASNKVYVFSERNTDPGAVAVAASHEAGHGFGLHHQSVFDGFGGKETEYNPGTADASPIMGFNNASRRKLWWHGTNTYENWQNDADVVAGSTNGFGYRTDDHGLAAGMAANGSKLTAAGVIERKTDADGFVFTTSAETVGLRVDVPSPGPTLDARVEVRTNVAAGYAVLASANSASLGERLSGLALPAGSYRLVVIPKHAVGGAGDSLGRYSVTALVAKPGGPYTVAPGGSVTLAASGPTTGLTYAWDLDADGTFGEPGETGRTPTFTATGLASGTMRTVRLRVSDGTVTSMARTTITVGPPSTRLLDPWRETDVGTVGKAGSTSVSGGEITVRGAGANIWGTADAFHYAYQPLAADGQVVARVKSLAATDAWAKAGVVIRAGTGAGARYAGLFVSRSHGVFFQYRTTDGGTTQRVTLAGTVPAWLKVVRSSGTLRAYTSTNGSAWTQVGSVGVALGGGASAGLAVTSRTTEALATAVFTNTAITAAAAPVTATGSATNVAPSSDTYARDGASASANYGGSDRLEVKTSGIGYSRISYLKFDLMTLPATFTTARLELFGRVDRAADMLIRAYAATSSGWDESTLTWNTRPALGAALGSLTVRGTTAARYSIDVAAFLRGERAAGRRAATIALRADPTIAALATFNSSEAPSDGPRLVVTA